MGLRKAKEMLYTGEKVDAQEALRIGMVNRVVPEAELDEATLALARRIAQAPPVPHGAVGALRHAPALAPERGIPGGARARAGPSHPAQQEGRGRMRTPLDCLLNPGSIAMIGASANAGRIGGMPLELLTRFGYAGGIYPVNPKYQEVFGKRCWPDIEAVPEPVDLAVLAIGAAEVTPMLRRCHAKGVRAAIVYAAGFAEAGGEGARLQDELEAFVAESAC
ncbi:hypothetical protein G6F22_016052 [Rhizopus arrhizus]|nr:hypothetical protein G6F22_016052 [Rhizopus arrhizus]